MQQYPTKLIHPNETARNLESDETIKQVKHSGMVWDEVEQPRRVSQPSASSAMQRALMRGTWHV